MYFLTYFVDRNQLQIYVKGDIFVWLHFMNERRIAFIFWFLNVRRNMRMHWCWLFFCLTFAILFGVLAFFERKKRRSIFVFYMLSSIFQIVIAVCHAVKIFQGIWVNFIGGVVINNRRGKYVLMIKLLLIVFLIGMILVMLRIVEQTPETSGSVKVSEYSACQTELEE